MNPERETEIPGTRAPRTMPHIKWRRLAAGFVIAFTLGAGYAWLIRSSGDWQLGLPWERALMLNLHTTFPRPLDLLMLTVPWLGSNIILAPATVLGILLLWKKRRDLALQILCAEVGSFALGFFLKDLFARQRPNLWQRRGQYDWAAYPSGHAISMLAVVFTFAHIYARQRDVRWPYLLAALILAVTLYSRLYLGLHWPTDILGGYLIGFAWLATTLASFPSPPRERKVSDPAPR